MVSSYTPNKNIEKPGNNDYVNNWNVPVNSDFDIVDAALGGGVSKALTNADVYLTVNETINQRILLQGTLTANVVVYIPLVIGSTTLAVGGMWIINNQCTGSFTVTIKTLVSGSVGVVVEQAKRSIVYSDGVNCYFADDRVTQTLLPQDLATTSTTTRFSSLGIGVAAPGANGTLATAGNVTVTGQITATQNIVAYYSDKRLKTITGKIENALDKVNSLTGYEYTQNELAEKFGYHTYEKQIGLLAQDVQKIAPEAVKPAPFDTCAITGQSVSGENYLTLQYERLVPLLVEAINELTAKVKKLEAK